MLSVLLVALCGAGELGFLGGSTSSRVPEQARAKIAWPLRRAGLVAMPGFTTGFSSIDGRDTHRVGELGGSLVVTRPLDSLASITVMGGLAAGGEADALDASALQVSLYLGGNWKLPNREGYGVGLSVSNGSTGTSVTPIATWLFRPAPGLRVSGTLPALAEIAWLPDDRWSLGVRQAAGGGSWSVDSGRSLQSAQVSMDLFVRRRLGLVALDLAVGWSFLDKIKYVEDDRSAFTIYGYDVFSSVRASELPNRPGAVVRVGLLFPGQER